MSAEIQLAGLQLHLGKHKSAFEQALKKAKADRLVERIWARDHTLWNPSPDEISNRLGWLDIASRMRAKIPKLNGFASQLNKEGLKNVLLLGMGGSSLAPELFSKVLGNQNGLRLNVLDSTDPQAVAKLAKSLNPRETVYIVSSKSGGTVETLSFFKYFYNQALEILGNSEVGRHFIAITDPGSGLADTAAKYSFRRTFLADPNIGGRYSALSHFGLVPAALVGADLTRLLDSAEKMMRTCAAEAEVSPGLQLGLALGALAQQGRDKATFVLPEPLVSFGDWVEQLVAESTGKQGKGILPVVREPLADAQDYGDDRLFVDYDNNVGLQQDEHPIIELSWKDSYDLGAQFFLWEFATAVAGYLLGINPFDQPDVESAKVQSRRLVEEYTKSGKLPKGDMQKLASERLNDFLLQAKPGDYIALHVYAAHNRQLEDILTTLRNGLLKRYKLATTAGYGPRFLHSTGQLHKGDRGNGLFIQVITPPPKEDLLIPKEAGAAESEISFGALKVAQALGDAQALREAGRRVISIEIEGELNSALHNLAGKLRQ